MSHSREALKVDHISKSFNGTQVVKNASFEVERGEVFGLIGPNGAGKTTTIRMVLRILQPDGGSVSIFGQPWTDVARDRIGYLPEERGLYRQARVKDVLQYMGKLKGLSSQQASQRSVEMLDRLDMTEHADKKVSELSRGMGQIIQFGATIIHDPDLVILDEPFSGLDPVNTERLKTMVADLQDRNAAVIFSTHLMNTVEELCDRVAMIADGETVLYGPVREVKDRYRNNSLFISWDGPKDQLSGVGRWESHGEFDEAFLDAGVKSEDVLGHMVELGGTISMFQISSPSLNEVFLKVAGGVRE